MTTKLKLTVAAAVCAAAMAAGARELRNGEVWPDTDGVHINAHGGGILKEGGRWYWFGEHKVAGGKGNKAWVGVRCYSSTNLVDWVNEGVALAVSTNAASDIGEGCILERPKVAKTRDGRFVMYFHLERAGKGYNDARTGVAVADAVAGPYRFVRSLRPHAGVPPQGAKPEELTKEARTRSRAEAATVKSNGPSDAGKAARMWPAHMAQGGQHCRDMTLFTDDDGTVYHVFASEYNSTLHLAELTADGLDYTGRWWRLAEKDWTEAPALVKRDGWYYLVGSGCTGWRPNAARYYRAPALTGPWERMGNPAEGVNPLTGKGPELTWGGQSACIFEADGTAYALFDEWRPANAIDGRYYILPIVFGSDHTIRIPWRDTFAPALP